MPGIDWIPLVSQAKATLQLITGDKEGAEKTWKNFLEECPGMGPAVSGILLVAGQTEAAEKWWDESRGLSTINNIANGTPVVGHIKGIVHGLAGDEEGAFEALNSATRSSVVIGAGIGTGLLSGGLAAIPAGIAAGSAYDIVETAARDEEKGIVRAVKNAIDNPNAGNIFDAAAGFLGDGMAGYSGGQIGEQLSNLIDSTSKPPDGSSGGPSVGPSGGSSDGPSGGSSGEPSGGSSGGPANGSAGGSSGGPPDGSSSGTSSGSASGSSSGPPDGSSNGSSGKSPSGTSSQTPSQPASNQYTANPKTGPEVPKLDHRGVGSYKDRMNNYNELLRKQEVSAKYQRTLESGLEPGPSGMPKRNFIKAPSRARAEDIARSQGHGHTPVHDTAHAPGQDPHFHVTDAHGERGNKNSPHVCYSKKHSSMPSPKCQRKQE